MIPELSVTTNFTFLTGASHPQEYIARSALLGMPAVAIADVNSVAGIVRAYSECARVTRLVRERQQAADIGPPLPNHIPQPPSAHIYNIPRLIPAARLVTRDGMNVTALAATRAGWGRLCRILSMGQQRAAKGHCDLMVDDLLNAQPYAMGGIFWLVHVPDHPSDHWYGLARKLVSQYQDNVFVVLSPRYDGQDDARFSQLADVAQRLQCGVIASASPMMHHGKRRRLADVLTAIRLGVPVAQLGRAALANGEQRLRSPDEMRIIFHAYPQAIRAAQNILQQLEFSLDQLRYEYPSEISDGDSPADRLRRLAYDGLAWRYPTGARDRVRGMLEHELSLISISTR